MFSLAISVVVGGLYALNSTLIEFGCLELCRLGLIGYLLRNLDGASYAADEMPWSFSLFSAR